MREYPGSCKYCGGNMVNVASIVVGKYALVSNWCENCGALHLCTGGEIEWHQPQPADTEYTYSPGVGYPGAEVEAEVRGE